jgi:hypothetical protein
LEADTRSPRNADHVSLVEGNPIATHSPPIAIKLEPCNTAAVRAIVAAYLRSSDLSSTNVCVIGCGHKVRLLGIEKSSGLSASALDLDTASKRLRGRSVVESLAKDLKPNFPAWAASPPAHLWRIKGRSGCRAGFRFPITPRLSSQYTNLFPKFRCFSKRSHPPVPRSIWPMRCIAHRDHRRRAAEHTIEYREDHTPSSGHTRDTAMAAL